MEFYAIVSKTSNSIISHYWSDTGIDTTKPGTDHDQSNLVHLIVPEEFKTQHFVKVDVDDSGNYKFQVDQEGIDQSIKDQWDWLREQRDKKLAACDWTVTVSDRPLSDEKKNEWVVYRQALRDLPANTPDPSQVTWPTPPTN
jgi:Phage tail assembly chaperone protein